MKKFIVFFLAFSIFVSLSKADDSPIKLHVFLHSHLDEGWIYTFEQYYQGTGTDDGGSVKAVFDNVYDSLGRNPSRKYQVAEVGFVNRWWSDQDENHRKTFKKYVDQKQIQFINGAWSTNDEACAYYEDIIDQFILGNRWLKANFGVYPSVGWHIDSFGHSETQAAIMAQAGYDGFFYGRLDHQDWETRRAQKTLEVIWKPQNPHNESIFGHALYFHYSDTKFMVNDNFYCRSIFCYGNLQDYELEKVTSWVKMQADSFETKNVAMLVGDDFHLWKESEKDFRGIEAMIEHYRSHPELGIEAKFSTINEYVDEVQIDLEISHKQLPEKRGDFFPYIENSWTSWVGYFTSKSMFKFKVRKTSQYYNAAKLLLAKFMLGSAPDVFNFNKENHATLNKALNDLEEPLGVVQHHDAVSGTMKDYVRYDYEDMLKKGWSSTNQQVMNILNKNVKKIIGQDNYEYIPVEFDWGENQPDLDSVFDLERNVLATAFNPGERDKFLIKIKVPSYQYKVADEANNYLMIDIICNSHSAKENCYIYFVDEIPAYSLKNYIISPAKLSKRVIPKDIQEDLKVNVNNQVTLNIKKNLQDFSYKLCTKLENSSLESLFSERKCIEDSFNLNYEYYESWTGGGLQVSSGAYVFRPRSDTKQSYSEVVSGRIFQGRVVTIVQIHRDRVRTDLKLVHHELERGIEIETHLEPVNDAYDGKEIVIMLRSKNVLNTDKVFYTDNNGYYMARRQLDHRDDFKTDNPDIPIPRNYYPITSAFYIETPDKKQRMTVVTDRAQGATSLNPGEIEIMIHRVTVNDDWKGLSETLDEMQPGTDQHIQVSTRHYLMLSSQDPEFTSCQRKRQYKLDRPLQFWFRNIDHIEFAHSSPSPTKSLDLPENVKFSIRSYDAYEYIIRLHNLDEKNSKNVSLFNAGNKQSAILNSFAGRDDIQVASVTELSLFTTKNKKDVKLNELDPSLATSTPNNDSQDLSTIELLPMEIRTFSILLNFL